MPPPPKLKTEIKGWREIRAKLKAEPLFGQPLKDAFEAAGEIGLGAARGAAPTGPSGQLKAKLGTRMSARPVPTWVKIRTTATKSSPKYRRYKYPGRLEYDPKSRRRGWMKTAIKAQWGRIQSVLVGAARSIEEKWGS